MSTTRKATRVVMTASFTVLLVVAVVLWLGTVVNSLTITASDAAGNALSHTFGWLMCLRFEHWFQRRSSLRSCGSRSRRCQWVVSKGCTLDGALADLDTTPRTYGASAERDRFLDKLSALRAGTAPR